MAVSIPNEDGWLPIASAPREPGAKFIAGNPYFKPEKGVFYPHHISQSVVKLDKDGDIDMGGGMYFDHSMFTHWKPL